MISDLAPRSANIAQQKRERRKDCVAPSVALARFRRVGTDQRPKRGEPGFLRKGA